MKVTCLLFLLLAVNCAAFMRNTSHAASPQHTSDRNHTRSRAGLTAANHPKQLPAGQKRPQPRKAASLHQPVLARSGGAARGGLSQSETSDHGLSVRRASVPPSVASLNPSRSPLSKDVRHRGPNPAVVGGPASWNHGNIGAINGAGMHRRP
jgi:hypothetical protein